MSNKITHKKGSELPMPVSGRFGKEVQKGKEATQPRAKGNKVSVAVSKKLEVKVGLVQAKTDESSQPKSEDLKKLEEGFNELRGNAKRLLSEFDEIAQKMLVGLKKEQGLVFDGSEWVRISMPHSDTIIPRDIISAVIEVVERSRDARKDLLSAAVNSMHLAQEVLSKITDDKKHQGVIKELIQVQNNLNEVLSKDLKKLTMQDLEGIRQGMESLKTEMENLKSELKSNENIDDANVSNQLKQLENMGSIFDTTFKMWGKKEGENKIDKFLIDADKTIKETDAKDRKFWIETTESLGLVLLGLTITMAAIGIAMAMAVIGTGWGLLFLGVGMLVAFSVSGLMADTGLRAYDAANREEAEYKTMKDRLGKILKLEEEGALLLERLKDKLAVPEGQEGKVS